MIQARKFRFSLYLLLVVGTLSAALVANDLIDDEFSDIVSLSDWDDDASVGRVELPLDLAATDGEVESESASSGRGEWRSVPGAEGVLPLRAGGEISQLSIPWLNATSLQRKMDELGVLAEDKAQILLALLRKYTGANVEKSDTLLAQADTMSLEHAKRILRGLFTAENDLLLLAPGADDSDDEGDNRARPSQYRQVLQAMIFLELVLGKYLNAAPGRLEPLITAYLAYQASKMPAGKFNVAALADQSRVTAETAQQLWRAYAADATRAAGLTSGHSVIDLHRLWFTPVAGSESRAAGGGGGGGSGGAGRRDRRIRFSPEVRARIIPDRASSAATSSSDDDLRCYETSLDAPAVAAVAMPVSVAAAAPAAVNPVINPVTNPGDGLRITIPVRRSVKRSKPDYPARFDGEGDIDARGDTDTDVDMERSADSQGRKRLRRD